MAQNGAAMANGASPAAKNGHLSPPRDLGRRWRRVRYNPIRNFTPERLTAALEQFDLGYLRDAALIWDVLERRDDVLKNAGPKRRKSVSRQAWEIVATEKSRAALRQKAALEYFYNNLSVTDAINENLAAGFPQLVRGMMDAQFQYFAVHEVVWRPGPAGLTAELRKVPLWVFENRTGRLRYTGPELAWDGEDLDEDGWLVTCGDGIMEAASVCCMFKRFSLQDWLNFGEKFGLPGIHGECAAAKGSAEWDDFTGALESFANDWIIATAPGNKINLIEAGKTGDAPFQPMVDRMDRRLAALCRGADLSSLSRDKEGTGASLQGDETDTLVEDDCALITETLNEQIDKRVIRLVFGPAAPVLANIRISPPKKRDIAQDLNVDRFLLGHGAPVSVADALERYGRPAPDEGEDLLRAPRREARTAPQGMPAGQAGPAAPADAANEAGPDEPGLGRFLAEAREMLATAMHGDLAPVRAALRRAIDGDLSDESLKTLRDSLPAIMAAMDSGDTAAALAAISGAALADGLAGGPEISGKNEFRSEDHPRLPKGAPESRGGQFAPKGDAEEGLATFKAPAYRPRGVDKTVLSGPGEPIPPRPDRGGPTDGEVTVRASGSGRAGESIPPDPRVAKPGDLIQFEVAPDENDPITSLARNVAGRVRRAFQADQLGDDGASFRREIEAVEAEDVWVGELSAVAVGRKPLFHEELSDNAARVAASLKHHLPPQVTVAEREGHVYAWREDVLGVPLDQIHRATVAGRNGRMLGYGSAAINQAGTSGVIISKRSGRVMGGFHAAPDEAEHYGRERARDYADALGEPMIVRIRPR